MIDVSSVALILILLMDSNGARRSASRPPLASLLAYAGWAHPIISQCSNGRMQVSKTLRSRFESVLASQTP